MNRVNLYLVFLFVLNSSVVLASSEDDPSLFGLEIDQLEIREAGGENVIGFEGQVWAGADEHKIIIKALGERYHAETDEAELQFLYSHAISVYWDVLVGLRKDYKPDPTRKWGVIAFEGLAPYFVEVEASLFIGESGRTELRLEAEHELELTQKWTLTPEVEINLAGQNDEEMEVGSGLSDIELGLRLSYEIHQKFSPYIGLNWEKKFGTTADYAREDGEKASDLTLVFGFSAWL
ncbi:MAG: copper resistance protein CopB [Cycloclasticus sp. symbiont of Poecilosclerida sp. M]|nr:MAG: copper resistance protein CopB [Cycloclasticus sp. symbiont of Poecilosclerida sp. M]